MFINILIIFRFYFSFLFNINLLHCFLIFLVFIIFFRFSDFSTFIFVQVGLNENGKCSPKTYFISETEIKCFVCLFVCGQMWAQV